MWIKNGNKRTNPLKNNKKVATHLIVRHFCDHVLDYQTLELCPFRGRVDISAIEDHWQRPSKPLTKHYY